MDHAICDKCGAETPEPGMYCCSSPILTCQGREPNSGCGAILTADERHWYGTCCEACEQAWDKRMEAWCEGGEDKELDEMFGSPHGNDLH